MVVLSSKNYRECGLTLIEVLIALAIVGIALTAVIKATSQNIRATNYLQQKTFAYWVGQEVMNKARIGLIDLPTEPDHLKGETSIFNTTLYWRANQDTTQNRHINKMKVAVFNSEEAENDPLMQLESYVLFNE